MTTVSPRKGHDPNRVNEISAKLMENPEIAELIGELSTSTDDASDLVKVFCRHRSTLVCRLKWTRI